MCVLAKFALYVSLTEYMSYMFGVKTQQLAKTQTRQGSSEHLAVKTSPLSQDCITGMTT